MSALSTNELKSFGQESYEEAYELLQTIGKLPAPSHNEDKRVEFVSSWFKDSGFKNVQVDAAKNVICSVIDDGSQDLIVFAAHTDVVFPDTEELPMHEEDGKLFAPGIGDDTSCLVSMLLAARKLKDLIDTGSLSPQTGILVVANSCEEGLGNLDGMKELFRVYGSRVKRFVSFDGTVGEIANCAVGSYRYRITVQTEGGHSYHDYGNANAIHILAEIICELAKIELPTTTHTTCNFGVIEGGTSVNSIAQDASVLYEFRSSSQECLEYMQGKLNAVLKSFQGGPGQITCDVLGIRPGNGDVDPGQVNELTEICGRVMAEITGEPWVAREGSTDSNIPLSLGIPAVTTGCYVGEGAHTREEYIELSGISNAAAIALGTMLELV